MLINILVFQDTLKNLTPNTSINIQADAATKLSGRLLGKFSDRFSISVDSALARVGRDVFKVIIGSFLYVLKNHTYNL